MIWITGDTHGSFRRVAEFCERERTTKQDVLIILGDACINYVNPIRDDELKGMLEALPLTLLCIHGNHELRPHHLSTYREIPWRGGVVYQEERFPSLLFAKDGSVYDLDGLQALAIGGACSVDRQYRAALGKGWWPDEQPDEEPRRRVEAVLDARGWQVDAVLSHTAPLKYEPVEVFLPGIDQEHVDKTTEIWLDHLDDRLTCQRWFCGHYHTDKRIRRMRFMLLDIRPFRDCCVAGA
jgi:3-oxoacid CoA-transferase subunit A